MAMTRVEPCGILCTVVLVASTAAPSHAQQEQQVSHQWKGLIVTVTKVERVATFSFGRLGVKAEEGQELVVVHVEASEALPDYEEQWLTDKNLVLYDEKGKAQGSFAFGGQTGLRPKEKRGLAFGVPKGAVVTTMKMDDVSFDLSKFATGK
jgi:hypothetical protein